MLFCTHILLLKIQQKTTPKNLFNVVDFRFPNIQCITKSVYQITDALHLYP